MRQRNLSNLGHECVHSKLVATRRANRIVGYLLTGLLGEGFEPYRSSHYVHHAKLGSNDDPMFQSYRAGNSHAQVTWWLRMWNATNATGFAARGLRPLEPEVALPRTFERSSGDVQCTYVVPDERDRGLGGELIEAVLAWAKDLGLERVTVHSSDRAVSAYSRHGFQASPRLLQAEVGQGRAG
ncbi:GNAT family N-acetyltransferase [Streptomyces kanamyceticus]|uniref:GNAT family N-acetyltransferase n=1 Tax=Streptomyces kanamyceticus TaxID=1967 RepID=UPI0037DDD7BF